MDKREKVIIALFVVVFVCSVSYTYYKTMVQHQFEIINYVP